MAPVFTLGSGLTHDELVHNLDRFVTGPKPSNRRRRRWVYRDEREYLENPGLSMDERAGIVRRLSELNRRSGHNAIICRRLHDLVRTVWQREQRAVRILDVGCGGGGLIEAVFRWASKQGIAVDLYGVDANPEFMRRSEKHLHGRGVMATLVAGNGSDLGLFTDRSMDIVVSSYVVHHVRTLNGVAGFFEEIRRVAREGWLVVDFERRFRGPAFVWLTGYLFGGTGHLVTDGVKSIRRAYTAGEINTILQAAGLEMRCESLPLLPYWIVRGTHRQA